MALALNDYEFKEEVFELFLSLKTLKASMTKLHILQQLVDVFKRLGAIALPSTSEFEQFNIHIENHTNAPLEAKKSA